MTPPRFCGIDTGETCALAVRERAPGGPVRWVYFEAPPIGALRDRCARILPALNVAALAIDGGPHTLEARRVHDLLPQGAFIWRHTEGAATVKTVEEEGAARRHARMNREELLDLLVEELHLGPEAVRWPAPRDGAEERLLALAEGHLMNLRKTLVRRAGGEPALVYERNDNHFGFACALARLAESLAAREGLLAPAAGGTVPPPPAGRRFLGRGEG